MNDLFQTSFYHTLAIARRVLRQIFADRRFIVISLIAPLLVIYIMDVFFESAERPFFDPEGFVMPIGAFIIHFITYVLCAIVLVRERAEETLVRMFINGYRQMEIIGGYVGAYTVLATVQSGLVLFSLRILFTLDYATDVWLTVYLVIWFLAVISIALGILVSNFARNEGQVFPFIPLVIVPSIFLSGIFVPLEDMPRWTQFLSRFTPLYYSTSAIEVLTETGGNFGESLKYLIWLPIYGLVVLSVATFTLREFD